MTNKFFTLASIFLLSFSLHAEDLKKYPCKKIKEACETAGFKKGDHKKDNKGLYIDCMKPLMAGQTVAGVTVSTDDVSACKDKQAKHKAKKEVNK